MIDGYSYSATIETVQNGFIVSYRDEAYNNCQKVFGNLDDAMDCVREKVFPKYVEDRHPWLGKRREAR